MTGIHQLLMAQGVAATPDNSGQLFTFTSSSTFTVPAGVSSIRYLVAAGGGGGGYSGGGGGGGGLLVDSDHGTVSVNAGQTYTITVGAGGNGSSAASNHAGAGASSEIVGVVAAAGGGGGGTNGASSYGNGQDGGSGGGGEGYPNNTQTAGSGNVPSKSPVQGRDGSIGQSDDASWTVQGGGGGYSQIGGEVPQDGARGGFGGKGFTADVVYSVDGATAIQCCGGGGGGGSDNGTRPGGAAGTQGGKGWQSSSGTGPGDSATANRGGGGGGGRNGATLTAGGNGAKGIVIIITE